MEVSSKEGINVDQIFVSLGEQLLEKYSLLTSSVLDELSISKPELEKKKSGCC